MVAAFVLGTGCLAPKPCTSQQDCGALAECFAGSCVSKDGPLPGGEGEVDGDGPLRMSAQVVVPGLHAAQGPHWFTLPLALAPTDLTIDQVGIGDCVVSLAEIDAAEPQPVTLSIDCATLHLGVLEVPLLGRSAESDVEISLTVRLVPSNWLDLGRTERELITLDVNGLLDGAAAPAGAPVFLAADRLPEGAMQQDPRLLSDEAGVVDEVPFEADGDGIWFSLPASARLWVYFAPATGAVEPILASSPWDKFGGVWHLEDGADSSITDERDDLLGEATPGPGVVGGAASFDGSAGLWAAVDLDPTRGTLSAWIKLDPVPARPRQVAVSVGADEAVGAFDPEGISLYADSEEQPCAHVGAGIGEPGSQQTSNGEPATLSDDDWHHVVVRWDGTTRELVVDGDVRRGSDGVTPATFDLQVLSIGSAIDESEPWLGAVDEVRLSSTALPATWARVEHASVTGLSTNGGRPFVHGLRPDLVAQSATATRVAAALPAIDVVPTLARGVLVTFVAARGASATGASLDTVSLSPLAPAAEGAGLSLTALSYEGMLDGSPLQLEHAGTTPDQVAVATLAFPGGTERGFAGIDLAAAPIVASAPQLSLAAVAPAAGPAWILVAVASREGVTRCDACGRHVLGPVMAGEGLALDVYAGEREPTAHTIEPVTAPDDDAAVVIVRVGP